MIDIADYGPVRCTRGRNKGRIGYYDDDHTEKSAIVYFGRPFQSNYEIIPRSWLEAVGDNLQLAAWARKHGFVAAALGVVIRRRRATR